MVEIPRIWLRAGLILARSVEGPGSDVIGDPCIVWDEELNGWRMFLFCQPPGHGQAICLSPNDVGAGHWEFIGPLVFSNPEALLGGSTHKPYIVMDIQQMNVVHKHGVILPPSTEHGHWAGSWLGGLQLIPGKSHRWLGLVNASPTAPNPTDTAIFREEPPQSLGGFAYCDENWPVSGWHWCPDPIEWIDEIPEEAVGNGEGTNLWRQNILALPDGELALFYNSGSYGCEQIYMKFARKNDA